MEIGMLVIARDLVDKAEANLIPDPFADGPIVAG
jgi:hypothetical protein